MNRSRSAKRQRRLGCSRNRRQNGGTAGMGYSFGAPVAGSHIINNYDGKVIPYASCLEATRPGYLEGAQIKGGLPGFSGGGKRRRSRSRRANRKGMKGGRGGVLETGAAQLSFQGPIGSPLVGGSYTNIPVTNVENPFMEVGYTGCGQGQEAITNPYSGGVDLKSLITAPAPLFANPTPMKGGKKSRKSRKSRRQSGGVGGVDSMFYSAPRSGYTTWPSNAQGGDAGTLADGKTPFFLIFTF